MTPCYYCERTTDCDVCIHGELDADDILKAFKAETDLSVALELLKKARSRMSRDAQGEDALLDQMDDFLKGNSDE
jgi:hypothetical protein